MISSQPCADCIIDPGMLRHAHVRIMRDEKNDEVRALRAENERLRADIERLRAALAGLLSVDNLTGEEFDRRVAHAREALERHGG